MKINSLTRVSMMTAVLGILAPMSIPMPLSPVPFTLSTMVLYMSIFVLNQREALMSVLLYLGLGAIGIPVFSGYGAGFSRLVGAGGGYLVGYLFLVGVAGEFVKRYPRKKEMQIFGCVLGTILMYIIGTYWLSHITNASFWQTIPAGMMVYLPFDTLKLGMGYYIGREIRKRMI